VLSDELPGDSNPPLSKPTVLAELLAALPGWLVAGVGLGVVLSVGAAVVFAVGTRVAAGSRTQTGDRDHADGTARRRAEIRSYLGRIDERYVEDATLSGRRVAFHLPEREVAVTFDPQTYFRLAEAEGATGNAEFDPDPEPEGVFVVLIEQEMPGGQLGKRLPFEVPAVDDPDPTDPVAEAFDALGLPTTAGSDRVESAYRDRVKQVHPDQGGDREAFTELREAYTTALDHADGE
jgi:DnaJ domain.